MEGGQKVNINLDSPIDIKSSDMLVPVDKPEFEHNRQKYQGHTLPSSLRFEADGWAAANDVYNFSADEGVIHIEGTDWTARKFRLNNNAAYLVEIYDGQNKLIGNVCINVSNRIIETNHINRDDIEVTDGDNAVILSGTFNEHEWTLEHSYALGEIDGVQYPQYIFTSEDEGALSCEVYIDDGVWKLAMLDGSADNFQKGSDYNTSGSGNTVIRIFDNDTSEEINIVVWQAATIYNESDIQEEDYEMGYYASSERGTSAIVHTFNKGAVTVQYNESFTEDPDTVTINGIMNTNKTVLVEDDNNIHFTFKQLISPNITLNGSTGDKTFFGLRGFSQSDREPYLIGDAPSGDLFVDNDIEIDSEAANILTKDTVLKTKGSFPIWSTLDIKLPDAPFKITSTNAKVLGSYIQASLPDSIVPEQRTTQTLSMLKIYHNAAYIPEPIYQQGNVPGIFNNTSTDDYVDPGVATSKWMPWTAQEGGRADTMTKAYGNYRNGKQFDTNFFKYDLDIFLCDIDPVVWAQDTQTYIPDKRDTYYLAIKNTTTDNQHTVDMKQSLYNNIKTWLDQFDGQIRSDGTDSAKQDDGPIFPGDTTTFDGPVYSIDMRLNKRLQKYIEEYNLAAQDSASLRYTTLGLTYKDAASFAVYAEKGTPDADFNVDLDNLPLTEVTLESNEIKLHEESYDFYTKDFSARYGMDETKDPLEYPDAAISTITGDETFKVTCNRQFAQGYTTYIEYEMPDETGTSGASGASGEPEPVPVTRRIMQTFGPEIIVAVNTHDAYVTNKGPTIEPIIEIDDSAFISKDVRLMRVPIDKQILSYLCQYVFPKLWKYFIHYAVGIAPIYNNSFNPPQPLNQWYIKTFGVDDFTVDAFNKFVTEHLVFRINDISINPEYIKNTPSTVLPLNVPTYISGIPIVDMSDKAYWVIHMGRDEGYRKAVTSYVGADKTPDNFKAYAFFTAPCMHTLAKTCRFTVTHTDDSHIDYLLNPAPVMPDGSNATHRALVPYDVVDTTGAVPYSPRFPSLLNTFKMYDAGGQVSYSGEYGPDGVEDDMQHMLPFFTATNNSNYFNNFTGTYKQSEEIGLLNGSIWQEFMSTAIFTQDGFNIDISGDNSVVQQGYGMLLPWLSQLEDGEVRVIYNGTGNKIWATDADGPYLVFWAKKVNRNHFKFFMFQRCLLKSDITLQQNTYKDFSKIAFNTVLDAEYLPYSLLADNVLKVHTEKITYNYAGHATESEIRLRSGIIGRSGESVLPASRGDFAGWSGDGYPVVVIDMINTARSENNFDGVIYIRSLQEIQNGRLIYPKATDTVNKTVNAERMFLTNSEYNELYHLKLYSNYADNIASNGYKAILSITADYIMYQAFLQNITKSITLGDSGIDIHDFFKYFYPDFATVPDVDTQVTPAVNTLITTGADIGKLANPYQYIICRFNHTGQCILLQFNREPVDLNTEIGSNHDEYIGKYTTLRFITDVSDLTALATSTGGSRTVNEDNTITYIFTAWNCSVTTEESGDVVLNYILVHHYDGNVAHDTTYKIAPLWDFAAIPEYYIAYRSTDKQYAMPMSFTVNTSILYNCFGKILQLISDNAQIMFNCNNGIITDIADYGNIFSIDTGSKVSSYKDDVFYVRSTDIDRQAGKFNVSFTYRVWCSIVAILRGVYKYGNAFDGGDN